MHVASGLEGRAGQEAARGSLVRLLAEAGSRALTFVTTLLVARGLGVVAWGEFAFLGALAVVAAELFDLGLHGTAQRSLVAGDLPLRAMLRAKAVLLGLAGFATVLVAVRAPVFALLVAFFAGSGWAEFAGVALRGFGRRGQEAFVLLVIRGSTLAAVASAVHLGAGLSGIALAHALSPLPAVLLGLALLRRAAPAAPDTVPHVSAVLRVSWPLAVNGGLALLNLRAELIALRVLRGLNEAGLFAAALRLVEVLNAVPSAIAAGAMPALTREATSGGDGARRQTALFAALLAAPCTVGLLLLAPEVAALLFGAGFESAAAPLRVLALALPLLFMGHVRTYALLAAGRARALPRLTAARLALALALAALLAPRFGALGAAFGFCASEALLLALAGRVGQAAGFAVPVLRPLLTACAATVPMALCVVALRDRPVLFQVALGGVVYAVTVAVGRRALAQRAEAQAT